MPREDDQRARDTAEAVARRSYGKLVAILAALTREQTSCSPSSALEYFCQWQRGRIELKPLPHALGDAIEQRHRQRAPFDHHR